MSVPVERLTALQGAAVLAGSSAEAMANGLQSLGQNLNDAVWNRNPAFQTFLNSLSGVDWKKTSTEARPTVEVMEQIADNIARVPNPMTRARIATQAFGAAGVQLLPILEKGAQGIRLLRLEAERRGITTQGDIDRANKLEYAERGLTLTLRNMGNTIASGVSPVLTDILTKMDEWLIANRSWIQTGIVEAVQRFGEFLKSIDWEGVTKGTGDFLKGVNDAVQGLGGWVKVTTTLFELWLGAKFLGMLANVVRVATALTGVGGWLLRAVPFLAPLGLLGGAGGEDREFSERKNQEYLRNRPRPAPAPTSAERQARERYEFDYYRSRGWSAEAAAGMTAQSRHESNFDPNAVGDRGAAYGIAQWHPDRQAAFRMWSGRDIRGSSFEDQVAFKFWEAIQGAERRAGDLIQGARSAGQAGALASTYYERPADRATNERDRAATAEDILRRLGPGGSPIRIASPAVPTPSQAAGAPRQLAEGVGRTGPVGAATQRVQVEIVGNLPPGVTARVRSASSGVDTPAPRVSTPLVLGAP
ncbi:phage tail tip lysozyme [Roseomonas chloroacetimidivorans]|uniref:phage tail tip lysozyme n=1 Tax=Roseomonas chloroacetimidivorans TaxID=1766656 RepID=UPI003C75B73D